MALPPSLVWIVRSAMARQVAGSAAADSVRDWPRAPPLAGPSFPSSRFARWFYALYL